MISMLKRNEEAKGELAAEDFASAVVKVAVLLVIGIFIINGICTGSNITASSPFYASYQAVQTNLTSGYGLASLMVLVLGAAGIMHFLGFMQLGIMKYKAQNIASPCKYQNMIRAGMHREICVKESKGKPVRANRL
jgi:hypothetical protein